MRARHGGLVLNTILKRIARSDIVLCDISTMNANVMIELGAALALKSETEKVFVFLEKGIKPPSDLFGIMYTHYSLGLNKRGESVGSLEDSKGFQAALRSEIIDSARQKGLWAEFNGLAEFEDNDPSFVSEPEH